MNCSKAVKTICALFYSFQPDFNLQLTVCLANLYAANEIVNQNCRAYIDRLPSHTFQTNVMPLNFPQRLTSVFLIDIIKNRIDLRLTSIAYSRGQS